MAKVFLAIGPDHDDYTIVKATSRKKAVAKFVRKGYISKELVEDQIEFIKVDVI